MSRALAIGIAVALAGGVGVADEPPKREKPKYEYRAEHDPDGIGKFYLGREIAHVMGYQAAGWLERKERTREEDPQALVRLLDLKDGMVVADVGAGSGYHALLMAPRVGPKGRVIASDVQQEMVDLIEKKKAACLMMTCLLPHNKEVLDLIGRRAAEEVVSPVTTVKGTATDPKLPAGKVDLILLVDVYHEFEHPYEMTEKMVAALAPGGRLVFVEFRLEDDKVPIKLVHKMSERQVIKEMAAFAEMTHTKTHKDLPWQHVVVFTKKAAGK